MRAERPRPVRVDPELHTVCMEAVCLIVRVEHVDSERFIWVRPDDGTRHPMVIGGLVYVSRNELVDLRHEVVLVPVFAIHERRDCSRSNLVCWNYSVRMLSESHAVAFVDHTGGHTWCRVNRVVVVDTLNLEVDIADYFGARRQGDLKNDVVYLVSNIPHDVAKRGKQKVITLMDHEVNIRLEISKKISESQRVELDGKCSIGGGQCFAQEIVGSKVGIPSDDPQAGHRSSGFVVLYLAIDLIAVSHKNLPPFSYF